MFDKLGHWTKTLTPAHVSRDMTVLHPQGSETFLTTNVAEVVADGQWNRVACAPSPTLSGCARRACRIRRRAGNPVILADYGEFQVSIFNDNIFSNEIS
eukprot:IDg4268t1